MKTNELRQGNWVQRNGKPFQVYYTTPTAINELIAENDKSAHYHSWKSSACDPIPLTEQWLVDFGWKQMGEAHIYGTWRYRYYLHCGWFYQMSTESDEEDLLNDEIWFVHQLQNLFFSLTGTELTKNQ